MKNGTASLGILAGIAAGTVLGMLFAPKKGCNLRRALVRKGENFIEALGEEMAEKYEEVKHFVTHAKKTRKAH